MHQRVAHRQPGFRSLPKEREQVDALHGAVDRVVKVPTYQFTLLAVRLGEDGVVDDEHALAVRLLFGGAHQGLDLGPECAPCARRSGQGARALVVAELSAAQPRQLRGRHRSHRAGQVLHLHLCKDRARIHASARLHLRVPVNCVTSLGNTAGADLDGGHWPRAQGKFAVGYQILLSLIGINPRQ